MKMAEIECLTCSEQNSVKHEPNHEEASEADGSSPAAEANGLSDAQQDVLERCLHALIHAKNDSHILAALLLVRSQKTPKNSISHLKEKQSFFDLLIAINHQIDPYKPTKEKLLALNGI